MMRQKLMSLYNRQASPTRQRRDRALILDNARPASNEPLNPDIKPSMQAKRSLKIFSFVVLCMAGLLLLSIKWLEHVWSRRDRAIMQSVSRPAEAVPAVLSPSTPAVPNLATPAADKPQAQAVQKTGTNDGVETIYRWGRVLEEAGELQGALTRYEEALAMDPENPLVLSQAGRLNIRLGRYGDAVALLKQAIAVSDANPDIMNDLGVALTFNGKAAEAVELYDHLLEQHPDYTPALFNKGYAQVQLRDYVSARPLLESYIERRDDDAMALGVLAILELAEENREKALELLDQAIKISPAWPTPYLDAASICAALERNEAAVSYLERALEVASPAEVYQHYKGAAFEALRISELGQGLEKKIAELARKNLP